MTPFSTTLRRTISITTEPLTPEQMRQMRRSATPTGLTIHGHGSIHVGESREAGEQLKRAMHRALFARERARRRAIRFGHTHRAADEIAERAFNAQTVREFYRCKRILARELSPMPTTRLVVRIVTRRRARSRRTRTVSKLACSSSGGDGDPESESSRPIASVGGGL